MAPFCDTINHHNVDSSYDVIKAEWRPLSFLERMQRYPDPQNPFSCRFSPFVEPAEESSSNSNREPNITMSESTTVEADENNATTEITTTN